MVAGVAQVHNKCFRWVYHRFWAMRAEGGQPKQGGVEVLVEESHWQC